MNSLKNNIFIITVLFILLGVVFFGQSSNILIDFSREIAVPYQMLDGKSLFKDIFLIYGFWGYFFNFLLLKIYPNILTMLIISNVLSLLNVIILYFIFKKYLSNRCTLFFSLAFIFCSVFSCATFSFVIPYSYSVLWAYFSAYLLLFSILYEKNCLIFISLSLLSVTRIELFLPLFFISVVCLIIKRHRVGFNFLFVFLFPIIFLGYILLNKISYNDILYNFSFIKKMLIAPSLSYLYKGMGVFFNYEYFIYNIKNLFLYSLIFLSTYFIYKKINIYFSFALFFILMLFRDVIFVLNLAVFILIVLFIISLIKRKVTYFDSVLFLFSLMLSLKSIFALNIWSYGNFSFILVIFNIYLLLNKFIDKNYLNMHFMIFFILLSFMNLKNLYFDSKTLYKNETNSIFIKNNDYNSFVNLDKFIKNNIKENEKLIVLPEGQIFNILNKKTWDFYNSTFTPLDFQTFGDEFFISQLKNNKTDYIVFYPRDTRDYGYKNICKDYAVDFCRYIVDNYKRIDDLKEFNIEIYKINYEK